MFRFIIEGVLLTFVSAFGIIGNIIAIYILSRPIMKASFSTLLIGMWYIQKIWSWCKLYKSHFNKFYQFMIGCHLCIPMPDFHLIAIQFVLIDIDYSKISKVYPRFYNNLQYKYNSGMSWRSMWSKRQSFVLNILLGQ